MSSLLLPGSQKALNNYVVGLVWPAGIEEYDAMERDGKVNFRHLHTAILPDLIALPSLLQYAPCHCWIVARSNSAPLLETKKAGSAEEVGVISFNIHEFVTDTGFCTEG